MARPRKPTEVLELTGAFRKDPQRRRPKEPENNGPIGEPPPHFEEAAKAVWRELVAMVPTGVLARSNRWLVELTCYTMLRVRQGTALASEQNLLLSCLSRMGLTPADRSKIAVEKNASERDELAELAAECRIRPN